MAAVDMAGIADPAAAADDLEQALDDAAAQGDIPVELQSALHMIARAAALSNESDRGHRGADRCGGLGRVAGSTRPLPSPAQRRQRAANLPRPRP